MSASASCLLQEARHNLIFVDRYPLVSVLLFGHQSELDNMSIGVPKN